MGIKNYSGKRVLLASSRNASAFLKYGFNSLLFSSLFFLFNPVFLIAQVENNYFEEAKKIYLQIAQSTGDARQFPELIEANVKVAHYDADKNHIGISPDLLKIFHQEYQAQASNAIALILGHELAHFYKDHEIDHDSFDTPNDISFQNEIKKSHEIQADKFAIYYSYLAGYETDSIAERMLDDLYEKGYIPMNSPNYPSKEDRKDIYKEAAKKTKIAIQKFEAGNLLMLMEKYEAATLYFEDIASDYPSKQLLNNMAVAYTRLALRFFDKEINGELKGMIYPLEFDNEIDLGEINIRKTRNYGGDISKEQKLRRRKYLENALYHINNAISLDNRYSSAYLNKTTILILQAIDSNSSESAFLYRSAKNIISEYQNIIEFQENDGNSFNRLMVNANILSAIIELHENNKKQAIAILEKIKNSPLAHYNLEMISKGFYSPKPPKKIQCPFPLENINFRDSIVHRELVKQKVMDTPLLSSVKNNDNWVQSQRIMDPNDNLEYLYFEMVINGEGSDIYILRPLINYKGKTCHGLGLGDSRKKMIELIGNAAPDKIQNSRDMIYYHYTFQAHIIYGVDGDGVIRDVIYFFVEEG